MSSLSLPSSRFEIASGEFEKLSAALRPFLQDTLKGEINFGDPILDYYSLCFPLTVRTENGGELRYFAKCPKSARTASEQVFPFSEADRLMAREEFASLQRLKSEWISKGGKAQFVGAICYCEAANCLVLELIDGQDFYKLARRGDPNRFSLLMSVIGATLSEFHFRSKVAEQITSMPSKKMRRYRAALVADGLKGGSLKFVDALLLSEVAQVSGESVDTLKGLDIRNIRVSSSGEGTLFDPGRIKRGVREEDLARFIASLRLLYWGEFRAVLGKRSPSSLEEAFLAGYGKESYSKELLHGFLRKELLKHWQMGCGALKQKPYPAVIKAFLKKYYVDAFFIRELRRLQEQ